MAITEDPLVQAELYYTEVIERMRDLRAHADTLEIFTDKEAWPFPGYEDLLFRL